MPDASGASDGAIDAAIDAGPPPKRIVILMIGDGMGQGQREAASHFAHGAAGQLFLESLPSRGTVITSSMSGTTDSAASATTLATGARPLNGAIGVDREGVAVETAVELAHRMGLRAGIVSTSSVTHATPASFTAHRASRYEEIAIAEDQVRLVQPDVMLGGGARYFLPAGADSARTDGGLLDELAQHGYTVARTATELAATPAQGPIAGLFASEHLEYAIARPTPTDEPTLTEMSIAALGRLDAASPDGFFLMIEGSRIDMACHGNMLAEAIGDTIAFDDTVRAVAEWAQGRDDVTLIVTSDHETGGLEVTTGNGQGVLPDVRWRWQQHTNAPVGVYARGPLADTFAGQELDHRWVHAVIEARLTGATVSPPPAELLPDGRLGDLAHLAVSQAVTESGFGASYNQLDSLRLAADDRVLAIGLAGAFERGRNTVVVLLDVDFGAGTGPARLEGALSDADGVADAILTNLSLDAPATTGFGVDLAVVSAGAQDPMLEQVLPGAGLRGLRAPYGEPNNLGWFGVATNFGDGTVSNAPVGPATPNAARGWEIHVPWTRIYPAGVPVGATLAVAAVLVNDDGGFTSNQALPPFTSGTPNPGTALTALPGIVVFTVDSNNDGVIDPIATSTVMP